MRSSGCRMEVLGCGGGFFRLWGSLSAQHPLTASVRHLPVEVQAPL